MKKLFMASVATIVFTISITLFVLTGCTKDDPKPNTEATYPIAGLWTGTFSANGVSGERFYSLIVYPDGTLVTRGKGEDNNYYYSSGTWSLSSDNTFSGTIVSIITPGPNSVTQSITATFSKTGVLTNGIWRDVINLNGGTLSGTFPTMKRVN